MVVQENLSMIDGGARHCVITPASTSRQLKRVPAQNTYHNMKRGLVVLVNFSDCHFTFGDSVATFYNHFCNGVNFTSYTTVDGLRYSCTGSVKEYWRDNSFGQYDPQFDIVGPVDIAMCHDSVKSADTGTSVELVSKAMNQARSLVDVADYDSDNDGYIDFVVMIAAGTYSNVNKGLWPHAWIGTAFEEFCSETWSGKKIAACAVLSELSVSPYILPVGSFCHEFGHLLGLPDLYNGPASYYPGEWDLMCSGDALNSGRSPAGLSLFERMLIGFSEPGTVEDYHSYTLQPLHEGNTGYILRSSADSSFFMLENRQNVKWDKYLPGHGLLVSRVALTPDDDTFYGNPYVGIVKSGRVEDSDGGITNRDTYPGAGHVRVLGMGTASDPFVYVFSNQQNSYPTSYLYDIDENDGVVSFNVVSNANVYRITEDFCEMDATPTMVEKQWQGQNFIWDFYSAGVVESTDSMVIRTMGSQPLMMSMPSKVETSNYVGHKVYQMSIGVCSPEYNTASGKVTLSYSTDGKKWLTARAITGQQYNMVEPGEAKRIGWSLDEPNPVVYRLAVTTSKANNHLYFETLRLEYRDYDVMQGDINVDGLVDVDDLNIIINVILGKNTKDVYKVRADVNGDGNVDIDDVNAVINTMLKR